MHVRIITAALVLVLAGCSTIAEIAYGNRVSRDKDACSNRSMDNSAYRACMDRVHAVEAEADKARKGH